MAEAAETLDLSGIDAFINSVGRGHGSLIPVLQKTQESFGYLPKSALAHIADRLDMPLSEVVGVATSTRSSRSRAAAGRSSGCAMARRAMSAARPVDRAGAARARHPAGRDDPRITSSPWRWSTASARAPSRQSRW